MADKVFLVTEPDDTHIDGIRILLVDLESEQTQVVSNSLAQLSAIPNIIAYVWKNGDDIDWLLDKKHKSNIIIFNANGFNELIIGYMAAQKNSYYFGTLKTLHKANNSAIYTTDDCVGIFENITKYE